MLYKNTKTGALIDTPCELSGENWEMVKPKKKDAKEERLPEEEEKK